MAKTTNAKAAARILNSLRDLTLVKNNGKRKTEAQKAALNASIRALEDEYLRLLGLSPTASYSDVTKTLTRATGNLQKVAADRKEMSDRLVSATKLLRGLGSVLKLVQ